MLVLKALLALASVATVAEAALDSRKGVNIPTHLANTTRFATRRHALPRAPVHAPISKSSKRSGLKRRGKTCYRTTEPSTAPAGDAAGSPPADGGSASADAISAVATSSNWKLVSTIEGENFFSEENWEFWNYDDPTHGVVDYVDSATAHAEGLASINEKGQAILKADTTKVATGRGRKAIRLHTRRIWTGGMVIFDASHMPVGCGVWPAWWQNGPNWPSGGEIDILEAVSYYNRNQVALHTDPGCVMPPDFNTNGKMSGTLLESDAFSAWNCASAETGNSGCGVADNVNGKLSYATGYNDNEGGVYALTWTAEGITIWFFPRGSVPADIDADAPNPDGWGTPVAFYPGDTCDMFTFFKEHINILNTTFCGDWAGNVWGSANAQDESCQAMTGYETCEEYVRNNGDQLTEAYWAVNSIKWYEAA